MPKQPHADGRVNPEKDERVALPLDPEEALRALLAVKPGDGSDDHEVDSSGTDAR